jgi:ABC-type metal ion transport system substrate-binding protein
LQNAHIIIQDSASKLALPNACEKKIGSVCFKGSTVEWMVESYVQRNVHLNAKDIDLKAFHYAYLQAKDST